MREKYEVVSKSHDKSLDLNRSLRDKIDCYRDVIEKLTTATQGVSSFPQKEKISCLKPLNRGLEIITPNIKARATVYSQQVKGKGKPSCKQSYIYWNINVYSKNDSILTLRFNFTFRLCSRC